jgi:uncharacterized protein YqeY
MNLKEQIKADLKTAMKEKNDAAKNTLKGILAEFTNTLVANGKMPSDELLEDEQIKVLKKLQKQRKDAIEKFVQGDRQDLADNEKLELEVIEKYLPEAMSKEQILEIAKAKKEELGIEDKSKFGMLIGAVVKETAGDADGGDINEVVESLFD